MFVLLLVLVLLVIILYLFRIKNCNTEAPPGPRAIPFIGHLHLFALSSKQPPHKLFVSLSQRYGPVTALRFGSYSVVIASTANAAKEFLKTHDVIFASRPHQNVINRVMMKDSDLGFAPYGDRWRQLRKLVTVELFTSRKSNLFKDARRKEVEALCEAALCSASSGSLFDAREAFTALTFNITTSMLMSKRYFGNDNGRDELEAAHFTKLMGKLIQLGGEFCAGDYFPWLRFVDPVEKELTAVARSMNSYLDACILERETQRRSTAHRASDFLDTLLDLRDQGNEHLQGPAVRSVMTNIIAAGTDTTATTLEWTLAEMIKHPEVMSKAQEELDRVVGRRKTMIEESDIPELKYLQAIVKESMRFHFLAPLLLPHQSTQSCKVLGYTIAKNTTLMVNAFAISRDPSLWEDPLVFRPERFLGSEVDVKGQHFELIPFGAGRRICPGMTLALTTIHLALANLVHMFQWKEGDGVQIDTTSEDYGLIVSMADKLRAIPITRPFEDVKQE